VNGIRHESIPSKPAMLTPDMSLKTAKYVIISPVRDEEVHLSRTVESVLRQSVRPVEWIIVNDGSTDRTAEIADNYARQHEWIRVVHRDNRGFRKSGGGVVDAFNDGYHNLQTRDWEFIVKLDGDLSFDSEYFQSCLRAFEEEEKLGIAGGTIYNVINGEAILEACPAFHVRGATKIYRRTCWDAIGGFWPAPGWDTMDEVKAQMLGWTTRTLPGLQVLHHRPTGKNDGTWGAGFKNGRANYICGYHPLFMLLKCAKRLKEKPYLIQSASLFWGFMSGYLQRVRQVDDRPTIKYLRRQQMNRLLGGETIWR
jgi:glycosyltransferase involved in cell wall biosynthesis